MKQSNIGIYLVLDAIISIYLASIGNITLTNVFNIQYFFLVSQFGRVFRLLIGVLFVTSSKIWSDKFNLKLVGWYLILDGIVSIVVAREFNSWDDYLRVTRTGCGIYLVWSARNR